MKKKFLSAILLAGMCVSLIACGNEVDTAKDGDVEQKIETEVSNEDNTVVEEKEPETEEVTEAVAKKEVLKLNLPGFEMTEMTGLIYYQKEGVTSNVVINNTANDGSLKNTTAQMMVDTIEPSLEAIYGELDVVLLEEENLVVDGHNALMYSYSYVVQGFNVVQTQYLIENGDEYNVITFTDFNEECTSVFEECMNTIEYVEE